MEQLMTFSQKELTTLLEEAAELGALKAFTLAGLIKPYLSKTDAYNRYGRRNIDRWSKELLIIPIKDGNQGAKFRLDRQKLETIAKTSNRHTYLRVDD